MPVIRASSLTGYSDCARRTASQVFKNDIAEAGYTLNSVPNNVGAAIGTGVHACMEYTLQAKIDGIQSSDREAEDRAITALRVETDKGIQYDRVSQSRNAAELQVRRKTKMFRYAVAPKISPVSVELRMEAEVRPGFTLSGQPDWREQRYGQNVLGDLKTGKITRFNAPQYGAYSLLSTTYDFKVDAISEANMKTVDLRKPEPTPEMIAYDPAQCEKMAEDMLDYMIGDYERFKQTGDNRSFRPNPSSMLCSQKYCNAFGTDFCKAHKGAMV